MKKFATTAQLKNMFDQKEEEGIYCIVKRMPVQDAFESADRYVREAVASYLKSVVVAMTGKEAEYTCFVCDEPWSKRCAPHQFLLIETMVSPDMLVSAICGGCCNRPNTILAALDTCFDTKFMIMQEAGHA